MSTQPVTTLFDLIHPRVGEAPLRAVPGSAVLPPAGQFAQVGVRVMGNDALSREGVIRFLQECPDVRVSAESGPDCGARTPADEVVVMVVDRISDGTVRSLRSLRSERAPRVVLVVGDLETARAAEVMQAGAVGIVRRGEVTQAGLRRTIRSVIAGEAVVPPDVLTALFGRAPATGGHRVTDAGLTDREQKVVRLLAEGSDTREIAHTLCYSDRTVKSIIQDITQRFGLRNRSHAVAYALRQGLI